MSISAVNQARRHLAFVCGMVLVQPLMGCNLLGKSTVEKMSAMSPDSVNAVVLQINEGGATSSYSYEIQLRKGTAKEGMVVWDSYCVSPLALQWVSRDTLLVSVGQYYLRVCQNWNIRTGKAEGVTSRTVVLPNSDRGPND